MATLIQNLQSIYNTKIQIKDVIGTQSDVFSEYPSLIEDALENAGGGITPSGSYSITSNGQYDVATYAYAYVNVPTGGSDHDGLTEALAYSVTELYTYMTGPAIYSTPTLYVKGKIAQIDEISSEYSNVTFWINDSGVAPSGGYEYNAEASTHANAAILRRVQYDSNGWVIPNNPTPKVGDDIVWRGTWDNNGQQIRSNAQIAQYVALSRPAASGSYTVTSNGQYDLSAYSLTTVNVPTGGGSGYYYPVHTVSDVTEFICEVDEEPFMWQWMANEVDGESGYMSSAVFTNKYWGYCYPGEFEVMENPVLDLDNLGFGLNMTSYTDLVKREFTYNALPDFNTYYGYTYSYEYANPYYNDENAPEGADTWSEYLTYEFYYGNNLLYSTQLDIVDFNEEPEKMSAGLDYMNGVWRVYSDSCTGMNGYWDSEWGEGTYYHHQRLSVGIIPPAEHVEGPLTQFTTTYHHAASYTSGFDPGTLCGYTWNAVVDGRGWLIDIISKGNTIVATDMWALDLNHENATYLTASGNNFTRTLSFSDEHTDDYGAEYYEMECNGTTHSFTHNYVSPWVLFPDVDLSSEDIPASGSTTIDLSFSGDDSHIEMGEINNYYHDWSLSVTLSIPNNWYVGGAGEMTASWTFSGTRNE